jgi:hypothetical protein|tara:strand:+ start:1394 stop:2053 length:660 start_codon:yes stop_codon:yes gene_type:complete
MSNYFRTLPNFEYISRINERKSNSDYITVKNLFRRALIREDIFTDFMAFTKYKIEGDERPDAVAYKFYGDSNLDWVVLASNNIINVRDEWPMTQWNFHNYLIEKYGSESFLSNIKHYETEEIKDSKGKIFVPKGKIVDSTYKFTFLDSGTNKLITVAPIQGISYLTYEERLQDDKRNINLLESKYLSMVLDDFETVLNYEPSSEYINPRLKKGSNPNLG